MEGFETHFRDEVLHCVSHGPVFFQRWNGTGGAAYTERMLGLHLRFLDRHPAKSTLSVSHIVKVAPKPPSDAERAVLHRHTELVESRVAAATTVISEGGFGGALARGIVSSLILVMRPTCPHKVCATLPEGLEFVLRRAPARYAGSSPHELARLYEAHCAREA